MEKPSQKWVKEPVGWLKDMWDQFGASGNVKGALMVATGLVIVLVALALVTRNMKALVAANRKIPQRDPRQSRRTSSTGCRNRGHYRGAVIEHHDLNTDTAFGSWSADPTKRLPSDIGGKCRNNYYCVARCSRSLKPRLIDRSFSAHDL